jgi:hypothetical protein
VIRFPNDAIDESGPKSDRRGRILRIGRDGVVHVLASFPRARQSAVTLTTTENEEILLTFSEGGSHALFLVKVDDVGDLKPFRWTVLQGTLEASPNITAGYVTEVVLRGDRREILDIPLSEIRSAAPPLAKGWW